MTDVVDTHIENREMVQPNHANSLQTAHGGHVLKWMDEVGAMSAMRFAGQSCVTARINRVDFERPIQVGDIALIEAYTYRAGRSSVRVRLQAFREDLGTGNRELTTESLLRLRRDRRRPRADDCSRTHRRHLGGRAPARGSARR